MNTASPNTLGRALRRFFSDYLPRVRGASSHTIQSYRDAFVLLLRFVAAQRGAPVIELDLSHLGPQEVLDFLQHLEEERHSVPATRNVRLAAIHAFFRYCAAEHPDHLDLCQRFWHCLLSERVHVLSNTSNSMRFRLCLPQLTG